MDGLRVAPVDVGHKRSRGFAASWAPPRPENRSCGQDQRWNSPPSTVTSSDELCTKPAIAGFNFA